MRLGALSDQDLLKANTSFLFYANPGRVNFFELSNIITVNMISYKIIRIRNIRAWQVNFVKAGNPMCPGSGAAVLIYNYLFSFKYMMLSLE